MSYKVILHRNLIDMEQLKHECGVAMVRVLKPLEYYQHKYGTWMWGLNKLYLLMEKQHNRGQEGAGIACVKLNASSGEEYMKYNTKSVKCKILFRWVVRCRLVVGWYVQV